ncbi:pyridoxamine 5'-phosphate oxidase family protein [Amycolatopsis sp.]|uniref:pyridoxamine 5'-phosphate oxidase family protein n=1 Tax=Amycolatopsis sp. TaxID=37632 RepID=UPI002C8B0454|nr:pyridoxamine 5'-phosphate oxidase family protein [Amycolatopsis sp.]HVV13464.1 pyridoxamine 5'-phosphate oxidase family protein [Amycolatopsis sp.]
MPEIRPLTPQECVDLLATEPVGRLAFSEDALPAIHPVTFFLHRGDIVVHTARTGALGKLSHEVVALEADRIDRETRTGWSVVAVGKAGQVSDPGELMAQVGAPWPGDGRSRLLRIPIEIITGRILRLAYDDAPVDAAG